MADGGAALAARGRLRLALFPRRRRPDFAGAPPSGREDLFDRPHRAEAGDPDQRPFEEEAGLARRPSIRTRGPRGSGTRRVPILERERPCPASDQRLRLVRCPRQGVATLRPSAKEHQIADDADEFPPECTRSSDPSSTVLHRGERGVAAVSREAMPRTGTRRAPRSEPRPRTPAEQSVVRDRGAAESRAQRSRTGKRVANRRPSPARATRSSVRSETAIPSCGRDAAQMSGDARSTRGRNSKHLAAARGSSGGASAIFGRGAR
jgi:hypothetical protein